MSSGHSGFNGESKDQPEGLLRQGSDNAIKRETGKFGKCQHDGNRQVCTK